MNVLIVTNNRQIKANRDEIKVRLPLLMSSDNKYIFAEREENGEELTFIIENIIEIKEVY